MWIARRWKRGRRRLATWCASSKSRRAAAVRSAIDRGRVQRCAGRVRRSLSVVAVLQHSHKPVVTGSFSAAGLQRMIYLLAADSGQLRVLFAQETAGGFSMRRVPFRTVELVGVRVAQPARAGLRRRARGNRLDATTWPHCSRNVGGFCDAARCRSACRHHATSTRRTRFTRSLGRRSGHLRHAYRRRADGCSGNCHAEHGVRGSG